MNHLSDEQLVEKYHDSETEALEILIQRYLSPIYGFVFKYVPNKDEAEDVTQDIFVKLWKNLNSFKPGYKFKSWLFIIAKNTALDHIKKKKATCFSKLDKADSEDLPFSDKIADGQENILHRLEREDGFSELSAVISEMPEEYRKTLDLRYNQQLKFREIAEILGISIDTVKTRHRRAILYLKEIFA